MDKPNTRYATSGSINIAYQVFGSGPVDLVYIPGWVSNIDWMWQSPDLVKFLTELGTVARVILFDKRGTGLSDRIVELSTLEERMDDIRAVMDAVNSEKAILFGHSEGGSAAMLFAATYPNRVISLITFGAFAKRRYAEKYPWAPTDAERQEVYKMIENSWGNGEMNLDKLAPTKAHDPIFMEWLANYFRSGASPNAAMLLTRMNTQVDIIHILSSIKVPTLILQRTHDIDVKVEEGTFLADHIENASFVELAGEDHLFWIGDTQSVLHEIKTFIQDARPKVSYDKQLLTILALSIPENAINTPQIVSSVKEIVSKFNGEILNYSQQIVATFEGPSKAVYCGLEVMQLSKERGLSISAGVHIMEVAKNDVGAQDQEANELIKIFLKKIEPNELAVTQTVKYLLTGTELLFSEQANQLDFFQKNPLTIYKVSDPDTDPKVHLETKQIPRDTAFVEIILKSINTHISEELTVSKLCRSVGISQRQLQRKLKTITSKSPIQFINTVKLHRAKELLKSKDLNIAEVAFKTGFSNPSYFSKKFKEEFGTSPSATYHI
ncbi:alpha/beta fold hydrolase [Ekhidna sp.]